MGNALQMRKVYNLNNIKLIVLNFVGIPKVWNFESNPKMKYHVLTSTFENFFHPKNLSSEQYIFPKNFFNVWIVQLITIATLIIDEWLTNCCFMSLAAIIREVMVFTPPIVGGGGKK